MKSAIVHHGDADGCTSGALALLGNGEGTLFSPTIGGSKLDEKLLSEVEKFDRIIVVDIGEKSQELMERLSDGRELLWIDHHKDEELIEGDFTYINPHKEGKEAPPASFLTYQHFKKQKDMRPFVWVAAIGILGDRAEKNHPEIFKKSFELFPNLEGGPSYGEMAILKKFVGIVSSGRSFGSGKGAVEAAEILAEAAKKRKPELVLQSPLMRYAKVTTRQVNDIITRRDYEVKGNLVLCELDTPQYIQNYVAGKLRGKFREKSVAVSNSGLYPDKVRIELRGNGEKNLRKIAIELSEGIGSGGGHIGAAGIRVEKCEWKNLKEKLVERLS